MQTKIGRSVFGIVPGGTEIDIFTLEQGSFKARIMTYGARLVSLETPDRQGKVADIVLGYDSLASYMNDSKTYFGAIVGRYANRIAHGKFMLDGKTYRLPLNDGDNSLHGGTQGFDRRAWTADALQDGVEMRLVSSNGDQGYPGTLTARVRYTLTAQALQIEYFAETDQDTILNLTNHSYFNLAGEGSGNILSHVLTIPAEEYTPVNSDLIPTGGLAPVRDTPFDFRSPTAIGLRIANDNAQLRYAKGYDENFVLRKEGPAEVLQQAAHVLEPSTGRALIVKTTQPGVQFYSGNFLNSDIRGKHGHTYDKHAGLCLETQHFPDSPNHPEFPTTELKPGQTFHSITQYEFPMD